MSADGAEKVVYRGFISFHWNTWIGAVTVNTHQHSLAEAIQPTYWAERNQHSWRSWEDTFNTVIWSTVNIQELMSLASIMQGSKSPPCFQQLHKAPARSLWSPSIQNIFMHILFFLILYIWTCCTLHTYAQLSILNIVLSYLIIYYCTPPHRPHIYMLCKYWF